MVLVIAFLQQVFVFIAKRRQIIEPGPFSIPQQTFTDPPMRRRHALLDANSPAVSHDRLPLLCHRSCWRTSSTSWISRRRATGSGRSWRRSSRASRSCRWSATTPWQSSKRTLAPAARCCKESTRSSGITKVCNGTWMRRRRWEADLATVVMLPSKPCIASHRRCWWTVTGWFSSNQNGVCWVESSSSTCRKFLLICLVLRVVQSALIARGLRRSLDKGRRHLVENIEEVIPLQKISWTQRNVLPVLTAKWQL